MKRHDLLSGLHERLQPRGYLEIGIRDGSGLARSRTRTIGVDPEFAITVELACDLQLAAATSDDFFARPDPLAWLPNGQVDLAFIDGMHLFEFALRDFINIERHSAPGAVVVFDDMLPRKVVQANRDRASTLWAGDVYKVTTILERHRPDLAVVPVDTGPTGTLLVAGLDPHSTVLDDGYDDIVAAFAATDPQPVPEHVLSRRDAARPRLVLGCEAAWVELLAARDGAGDVAGAVAALNALRGTAPTRSPEPTVASVAPPKRAAESRRSLRTRVRRRLGR